MTMSQIDQSGVRREKTAIFRLRHSKPMMLALSHGIIGTWSAVMEDAPISNQHQASVVAYGKSSESETAARLWEHV
jgi:hypothetical protein